jgi:hypothetical protein
VAAGRGVRVCRSQTAARLLCRYTTIKSGRRRLLVPNSAFITREFMVLDDSPPDGAHNLWDKPQVGAQGLGFRV